MIHSIEIVREKKLTRTRSVGGGGKCGEKHHHHTKVVHVPVPVPVPVKVHEEKHHDHWGSASNTHEDNWASASSNEEIKPHHKGVKVSAASVPPHRPFNAHNHMMNRMEAGKAVTMEPKSTGLLQTLLNNEKPSRPDKKATNGKSTDTAGKKKAAANSESKHDKETGTPATSPQLITHHHLIDPNAEMMPPPAAFGLMQPEGMQAAIMQPAFLSPVPAMNEMHQQHLQAAVAAQQQSQMQQFQQQAYEQQSQLQQQQYQQQQSQIQQQYQQQQPPQQQQQGQQQQQQQPTLEQQQMHEAMIQQQLQQLQQMHMQQQFEQALQAEHQKMQEAMASSIPQQLPQNSPLASQLPIPLPGQGYSAPVFEPITNGNQTDKTPNGNPLNGNPMNGNLNNAMPPFNELEIIPYEVQQQLQAAAHMRQFASHVSEPHAPLKELPSNRENSLINYNRDHFKEHLKEHFKEHFKEQSKNAKHQFEHIAKGNYASHLLRSLTFDHVKAFYILITFIIFKWIVC